MFESEYENIRWELFEYPNVFEYSLSSEHHLATNSYHVECCLAKGSLPTGQLQAVYRTVIVELD